MRSIGVVTVARSDYGIYLPVLEKIQANPDLRLWLIVAGMHLSPEFGSTVRAIEADGYEIGERVDMLLSSDTPEAIAKSMGLGTIGLAQAYARLRPDILVVLGDRFEMHSAALAALPFKIPVAHIHGGEVTEGAIDDALRHSITKLSHLHFVATEEYRSRVIRMGEEPWRVILTGAPSLDNLRSLRLMSADEVEAEYGIRLAPAPLLVTFHPETLEFERTAWHVGELLAALDACGLPVLFTLPNADTSNGTVSSMISDFVARQPGAQIVDSLGTRGYFSLMSRAAAMVGNSSSGIIEAASFELPVVNIGRRQKGRVRAANVIDVGHPQPEILSGIRKAVHPGFRENLRGIANPYVCGHASEKIVDHLANVDLNDRLVRKSFYDLNDAPMLTKKAS